MTIAPLNSISTYLKPQGLDDIPCLEASNHEKCWIGMPISVLHGLGHKHQIQHDPTDEAWSKLAHKLQVHTKHARIQLTSHEEVVQSVTWKTDEKWFTKHANGITQMVECSSMCELS